MCWTPMSDGSFWMRWRLSAKPCGGRLSLKNSITRYSAIPTRISMRIFFRASSRIRIFPNPSGIRLKRSVSPRLPGRHQCAKQRLFEHAKLLRCRPGSLGPTGRFRRIPDGFGKIRIRDDARKNMRMEMRVGIAEYLVIEFLRLKRHPHGFADKRHLIQKLPSDIGVQHMKLCHMPLEKNECISPIKLMIAKNYISRRELLYKVRIVPTFNQSDPIANQTRRHRHGFPPVT